MKIPISQRLLACSRLVAPGARVADIGCDHGYLSIYLLQQGIASSVIAADLRKGPLQTAVQNAERFGVQDKIQFILSDGLKKVPHTFDTLICAGMGGETIISILQNAPWLQDDGYSLILQCQTKSHLLRKYLSDTGWEIQKEHVLKDGKFLYTIMEVRWHPGHPLSPGQFYFPMTLCTGTQEHIAEHFSRIIKGLRAHVTGCGPQCAEWKAAALQELENLEGSPDYTWLRKEDNNDDCK